MSRFDGLIDDDEEEEEETEEESYSEYNPLEKKPPTFSPQQIFDSYQFSSSSEPPQEIKTYNNIYVAETLKPECLTFKPPKSDINSTIFLPGKSNTPPNTKTRNPKSRSKKSSVNNASNVSLNTNLVKPFQQEKGTEDSEMWVYKDQFDKIIGPFSSQKMRDWFNKGFIDSTLLVRLASLSVPFQPISFVFPDLSKAFLQAKPSKGNRNNVLQEDFTNSNLTTLFSFSVDDTSDWE